MRQIQKFVTVAALALGLVPAAVVGQGVEARLDAAIAGDHRSDANRARDVYRHPRETLLFMGLEPE